MKSISIIIPCFNSEKIIKKNLNLIKNKLKKKKLNYEIILINDGSTDNTLKILKEIKTNINNIKIINNKKKFWQVLLSYKRT